MMLKDAKNEVLSRISSVCGFEVKESDLSPALRESVNSVAETIKQLSVLRNLLLVEKKDSERLASRIKAKMTGRKDDRVKEYLKQMSDLHNALDEQIKTIAKQAFDEIQRRWDFSSEQHGQSERIVIEQLKCKNCGAPLKPPTSYVEKCEYCGTVYELSEYLDRLEDNITMAGGKEEKKQETSDK